METKVAAIAKDEAPYIAQWVFHHLYFGFSSVEVIVNKTTDRTCEILQKISLKYPVEFTDIGLGWYGPEQVSFQKAAYIELLAKAKQLDTQRLMFVDIDELWTPRDFQTLVGAYLEDIGSPEIVSFEWALLRSDYKLFGLGYKSSNQLCKNNHLKTLFNPELDITKLSVHNVECLGVKNVLADGSPNPRPYKDRLMDPNIHGQPLRPAFILHRYWRSPLEYVALLGQGLAQERVGGSDNFSALKLNRNGFSGGGLPTSFNIDKQKLDAYTSAYTKFLKECGIEHLVESAQRDLIVRVGEVMARLREHAINEAESVKCVLSGLDIEACLERGEVIPTNPHVQKCLVEDQARWL